MMQQSWECKRQTANPLIGTSGMVSGASVLGSAASMFCNRSIIYHVQCNYLQYLSEIDVKCFFMEQKESKSADSHGMALSLLAPAAPLPFFQFQEAPRRTGSHRPKHPLLSNYGKCESVTGPILVHTNSKSRSQHLVSGNCPFIKIRQRL